MTGSQEPEVTVDIAVGQMRSIEFVADAPGDWAMHCHKSHHTMNAMGRSVKTYIGVKLGAMQRKIAKSAPGYMAMGSQGMADMGAMEMPLPDNTLPMTTGFAQFGPVEMGGMFTVLKIREGLARGDYKDPGWRQNPEGTVAHLVETAPPDPPRQGVDVPSPTESVFRVVKPHSHNEH